MVADAPWSPGAGGVKLAVRLTPRASRDALDGVVRRADGSGVLHARVRAVPENGRANEALLRLVAGDLGLARSCVCLIEGAKSRLKVLLLSGDAPVLIRQLAGRFG